MLIVCHTNETFQEKRRKLLAEAETLREKCEAEMGKDHMLMKLLNRRYPQAVKSFEADEGKSAPQYVPTIYVTRKEEGEGDDIDKDEEDGEEEGEDTDQAGEDDGSGQDKREDGVHGPGTTVSKLMAQLELEDLAQGSRESSPDLPNMPQA